MRSLTSRILDRIPRGCVFRKRARVGTCRIVVPTHIREPIFIDLDKCKSLVAEDMSCCDYLFFGSNTPGDLVAPIEMKARNVDSDLVERQLQGGADVADKLVPENHTDFIFRPILVSKALDKRDKIELRKKRVSFRGRPPSKIFRIKCGEPLGRAGDRARVQDSS